MAKKANKLFGESYVVDQLTGCYMIEIALTDYADIFNEWDPAPFKRREIDPDLVIYLENCSAEIPSQYPIELCFTVPGQIQNEQAEAASRNGIENSLRYLIYDIKEQHKANRNRILRFILLGLSSLWLAEASGNHPKADVFSSLLVQGIAIGGWFFLGEAGSLLFFANRNLRKRNLTYSRLKDAPIIFRATVQS